MNDPLVISNDLVNASRVDLIGQLIQQAAREIVRRVEAGEVVETEDAIFSLSHFTLP